MIYDCFKRPGVCYKQTLFMENLDIIVQLSVCLLLLSGESEVCVIFTVFLGFILKTVNLKTNNLCQLYKDFGCDRLDSLTSI